VQRGERRVLFFRVSRGFPEEGVLRLESRRKSELCVNSHSSGSKNKNRRIIDFTKTHLRNDDQRVPSKKTNTVSGVKD